MLKALQASPMAAPHLQVADRPACEMISQVKLWSKETSKNSRVPCCSLGQLWIALINTRLDQREFSDVCDVSLFFQGCQL